MASRAFASVRKIRKGRVLSMAKKAAKKRGGRPMTGAAERLASASQLIDMRLVESHAQQAELPDGALPTHTKANAKIVTSISEQHKRYRVEVFFELLMSYEDAPDSPAIGVAAKYRLTLSCENSKLVTEEATAAFGQTGAMFILWPYWRQHTAATLSAMGLPAYTLPLYKAGFFSSMEEIPIEKG